MKKINLGSGERKMEGFINIDADPTSKPDLLVDVEKGLPFKDSSIDYIYSAHFLEHIRPDKYIFVLNEIQRIAKNGCVLELALPFDHIGTRTFIPHFRTYGFNSFDLVDVDFDMDLLDKRSCYTDLKLRRIDKKPNLPYRLFFYMFSFLKNEIKFKFKIVKEKKE